MHRLQWIGIVFTLVGCDHAAAAQSTAATTSATASTPDITAQPLSALLAGAASVKVTANGKSATVSDATTIGAVEDALGRARTPTAAVPRCLTASQLSFLDSAGREIARVGLCDGGGPQARIDLPDHRTGGLDIADLAALRAALACPQAGGKCVSNAATIACKSQPPGLCASSEICCVM